MLNGMQHISKVCIDVVQCLQMHACWQAAGNPCARSPPQELGFDAMPCCGAAVVCAAALGICGHL